MAQQRRAKHAAHSSSVCTRAPFATRARAGWVSCQHQASSQRYEALHIEIQICPLRTAAAAEYTRRHTRISKTRYLVGGEGGMEHLRGSRRRYRRCVCVFIYFCPPPKEKGGRKIIPWPGGGHRPRKHGTSHLTDNQNSTNRTHTPLDRCAAHTLSSTSAIHPSHPITSTHQPNTTFF